MFVIGYVKICYFADVVYTEADDRDSSECSDEDESKDCDR